MEVGDPGHKYLLENYDCPSSTWARQMLTFMKREGEGYPGNVGHYHGTNLQEVMRALIDRAKYLDGQIPHQVNAEIVVHLRQCIRMLEERANDRHGISNGRLWWTDIEHMPTCHICGHIFCHHEER